MTIIPTTDLNCDKRSNTEKYIMKCEDSYSSKISEIAMKIYKSREVSPIVIISGPSGSGKTTTAKRIQQKLAELDVSCKAISMDDYYLPKESPIIPYNEDGTPDLESPFRLDVALLKEHFEKMLKCEEVYIPKFEFANQSRLPGETYKRSENEIVIIEGTHALNPAISGDISENAIKIYISVRTRIKLENARMIHPSVIRLMRRLSRDCLFRGKGIENVFEMFESVSYGEKKHITPFKKYADIEIDTFIPYEVQLYKSLLKDKIKSKRDDLYENENYKDIVRVFNEIEEIEDTPTIPSNSLLREFIGKSLFTY